jgi:hydrogenase maturation factor
MKAEKPAVGIMKTNDWGEAQAYKIECVCGDSEHAHNVWVEADELGVTVTTYTMIKSKWWSMNRLQTIWKLLTKGYVEYEGSAIMTRQQALNYAETIKSAIADVETFRKKQNA